MFNTADVVINAFTDHLANTYRQTYSNLEPSYPGIIAFVERMALENIANSDSPYHDMNHTVMVTAVGQEILRGRHLREGGVTPSDWLHYIISLLCHDIGYVRGVLKDDRRNSYVINESGETVSLPAGATDASLTPYHVERGKMFVYERLGGRKLDDAQEIDSNIVVRNLEHTRFPVPEESDYRETTDYPGLVRAADLIGQMADPNYMRKISALFREFQETGAAEALGYENAADLRAAYPRFYWKVVAPYIQEALRYLRITQEGKQWIASLYAQVFAEEHDMPDFGPELGQDELTAS